MIKINLAPIDELENPFWWVFDLVSLLVFVGCGYFGLQYYLGSLEGEYDRLVVERNKANLAFEELSPDVAKFQNLQQKIADLTEKKKALKEITVSRIARFEPVILLEHIQNLKPNGVWIWAMDIPKGEHHVHIVGQAFDNILIAEFISALMSTQSQQALDSDLRSLVYFDKADLAQTKVEREARLGYRDLKGFPEFDIKLGFSERNPSGVPSVSTLELSKADKPKQDKAVR